MCSELGLCSAKDKNVVMAQLLSKALPMQKNLGAIFMPGPVIVKPKPVVVRRTHVRASAQCTICEFAMRELDGILKENSTKVNVVCLFVCWYSSLQLFTKL